MDITPCVAKYEIETLVLEEKEEHWVKENTARKTVLKNGVRGGCGRRPRGGAHEAAAGRVGVFFFFADAGAGDLGNGG